MNSEEYGIMYRVEDSHWWYRGMERITRTILGRWYSTNGGLRILDAGCGTGASMAGYLADYGKVTGFDIATEALKYCKLRGIERLAQASAGFMPFQSSHFDLATSFDALCERSIGNDLPALKELYRVLAPGGRVLLRLPALKWLGGQHDQAVHIAHRYTRQELVEKLTASGFTVQQISYANTILLPFIWIKRRCERFWAQGNPGSDLTLNAGPINGLLRAILACEAPLIAHSRLPVGVSVIAVGQKL